MGFVDLHAHVLPGIDDGAEDLAESMTLLAGLRDAGFDEVCATPHQKQGSLCPSFEQIRAARAEVGDGAPVRLTVAAENFWDDVLFGRLPDLSFPRYEPAGKAFLFEVPVATMPPQIEDHLFRLRVRGVLPVMAHPERYTAIRRDLARAEALGRTAALVVDLGALAGAHGGESARSARALVEQGLAHAAASDAHHAGDLREVAQGIAWLRKRLGEGALKRLLEDGPRSILAGHIPEGPER